MRLGTLLHPKLIKCGLAARDKAGAVRELAELLAWHDRQCTLDDLLSALGEREKLGALSMGRGLAFPHARTEKVEAFSIVVGTSEAGIDFGAPDGQPVRVIVLFVVPKRSSGLYLQAFASLLALLNHPAHLAALLAARSPEEFLRIVEASGIQVREPSHLKDVMSPLPCAMTADRPLREAVDPLIRNGADFVPVVDGEGKLLGEVNALEIVRLSLGDYLLGLTNSTVLATREPFMDFLRLHGEAPLSQFCEKEPLRLPEEASLLEAALLMTRGGHARAFVVKGAKAVGWVSAADLVRRIAGARSEPKRP
jgi:mannitol/fructose-specific phosphotransferase system IIA component (Ntr-type)/CBS domain-containing protein